MEGKQRQQEELDKANLDLAKKRDQHKQEEHKQRRREAHRKEVQELHDNQAKEWAQVMQMLDHTNPLVLQHGEQVAARLTTEEEGNN